MRRDDAHKMQSPPPVLGEGVEPDGDERLDVDGSLLSRANGLTVLRVRQSDSGGLQETQKSVG